MPAVVMLVTLSAQTPGLLAGEADLSSPLATARTLFIAVTEGNAEGVKATLYAADDAHLSLNAATAELIVAGKRLADAAHDRYGKSGETLGRGALDPANLKKLEQAKVEFLADDRATLTVEGQPRPMSFRKSADARWRLVIADPANSAPTPPDALPRQIKLTSQLAAAMNETTAEIRERKYATAAEAEAVLQSRLHAVTIDNYKPTTRASSTTRAATIPG